MNMKVLIFIFKVSAILIEKKKIVIVLVQIQVDLNVYRLYSFFFFNLFNFYIISYDTFVARSHSDVLSGVLFFLS